MKNLYEFKPGDRIRLLRPQLIHNHTIYDKIKLEPAYLRCVGNHCPICKAIEKFRHIPWYVKLWNRIRGKHDKQTILRSDRW